MKQCTKGVRTTDHAGKWNNLTIYLSKLSAGVFLAHSVVVVKSDGVDQFQLHSWDSIYIVDCSSLHSDHTYTGGSASAAY